MDNSHFTEDGDGRQPPARRRNPQTSPKTRLVLSNRQWRLIEPLLPGKRGDPGRTGRDNRLSLEGILYIIRTGTPWRDLPERFGKWATVYQRFRRWKLARVFDRIFESTHGLMDYRAVMVDGSFIKVHKHGTGARRNGGTPEDSAKKQAIGRSRGGLTSKIMALTDANGRICKFSVVAGNAYEGHALPGLIDGVHTHEVIGDKAYDSGAIRQMLADRNIIATIPYLSNRKVIVWYDPDHYASRHLVENWFGDAKEWRGVATRYCKLLDSYIAFLNLRAWHLSTKAGGRATKKPVYKKNNLLAPAGPMQLAQIGRI